MGMEFGRCTASRQEETVFVPSLGRVACSTVCESTARRLVLLQTDHEHELTIC